MMNALNHSDLIINIYSSTRYASIYHRPTGLSVGGYPTSSLSLYGSFREHLLNRLEKMVCGDIRQEEPKQMKKEEKPVEVMVRKRGRPRKYV